MNTGRMSITGEVKKPVGEKLIYDNKGKVTKNKMGDAADTPLAKRLSDKLIKEYPKQ